MKLIYATLALIVSALILDAQLVTLGPYKIYQSTDSNMTPTVRIDCRGQKEVAIVASWIHNGTATAADGFRFYPSIDGSTAVDVPVTIQDGLITNATPVYWLTKAANSTTAVTAGTNFHVGPYPYLILSYITNKDADTYMSNVTVKYWIKKNSP